MARQLQRHIETVAQTDNGISRIELPRNHFYKGLLLRLTGRIDIGAGGGVDGAVHDENPMSLIRQVSVIRNGSEVLWRADGGTLFQLAAFSWGTDPFLAGAIASTAVANTEFEAAIPIDFAALGMANPSMTLLRGVGNSSLVLEIVWGTTASIAVGGNRTYAFGVTPTCEVYSVSEIMDLGGDSADKLVRVIQREITGASARFAIDLETGPTYRRLILKTTEQKVDGAAAVVGPDFALGGTAPNALLNSIRLEFDGTLVLADLMTAQSLRLHNKSFYQREALPDGYHVIDFCEDGSLSGLIETAGASSFRLVADVNAPTTGEGFLRVITETYTAPRARAA